MGLLRGQPEQTGEGCVHLQAVGQSCEERRQVRWRRDGLLMWAAVLNSMRFFYIFFLQDLVHFYSYIFLRSISRSTKEINTKEEKKIMYSLALE